MFNYLRRLHEVSKIIMKTIMRWIQAPADRSTSNLQEVKRTGSQQENGDADCE